MSDEEFDLGIQQEEPKPPYIIRKVIKRPVHSHGGSWKVAYADFATAMMAFFLLMWVIGATSEEEKQAISNYFVDPGGAMIGEGGANRAVINMKAPLVIERGDKMPRPTEEQPEDEEEGMIKRDGLDEDEVVQLADLIEHQRLDKLKENLEEEVGSNPSLRRYKDQVYIDIVPDGLRIQMLDKENRAMFDSGSPNPKDHTRMMFSALAKLISRVPNKVSITGHTDAQPFVDREDYSNWELSADRANAARRSLILGGLDPKAIAKVEGFGASALHDKEDPNNPINRRIAIIVLKKSALEAIDQNTRLDNIESEIQNQ